MTTEAYVIPTLHPAGLMRTGRPLTDVIRYDIAKAVRTSLWDHQQQEQFCIVLPTNPSGLAEVVRSAAGWMQRWKSLRCPVAVDVETSSISFWSCRLYSIALCGEDGNNCGVAFTLRDFITLPADAQQYLEYHLSELLRDPAIPKTYHNAPFDKSVLTRKGFEINGQVWDTQGLHHLVQPDIYHDLGWVGHTYLDVEPWKLDHHGKKMAFSRDVTELLVYNAKDAINTAKLRQPLLNEIYAKSMNQTLVSWQMAFSDLACRMELAGIPINQSMRQQIGAGLLGEIQAHLHEMRVILNWPDFDPNKPTHAREAIYGKKYRGLHPTQYTEKTQEPSTSYHAYIDHLEDPFIQHFTKYVEKRAIYSTQYLDPGGTTFKGEVSDKGGAYARAIYPDGRLHCKWNPTGQRGSRFSSEPNCLDAETEVLTREGWLFFPDAVSRWRSVKFAQYNPESEKITFRDAEAGHHYKGRELLLAEGQQVSICGTRDHRMLLREYNPNKHSREASVVPLESLPQHKRFVHAGSYAFGKTEINVSLLQLSAACQADGSWGHGGVNFDFKHEWKYRRLRALLDLCGATYGFTERPDRTKHRWRVRMQTRCPVTLQILGLIGPERAWGPWVLDLTRACAEALLDEALIWDAHTTGRRRFYYSSVKANADWIQTLAVLLGKRASMLWSGTSWRVSVSDDKAFSSARVEPLAIPGAHDVYCVSVPSGYIITRRRGKVLITGNCQNIPQYPVNHRVYMEAPEGRMIVGSDKDQLELRLIAVRAGVEELLTEMRKPDGDPHTLAAINVHGAKFLDMAPAMRKLVRDMIKNVVYAAVYMAGVLTVWHTIRERKQLPPEMRAACTKGEVSKIMRTYFGRYTQIPEWHQGNYARVEQYGFLEIPPLGRRRYFPVQPAPFNEVANWPIQTVGSDIVGMEMVQIDHELRRKFRDCWVILHGHDAVYVECYERDAEAVAQTIDSIFGGTRVDGPAGPVWLTGKAKIAKSLAMKPNLRRKAA